MSDELEYQPGHDYGVGLYSIDGSVRGDAVNRTPAEEVTGAGGQQVKFFMEQVDTTESLTESLSASADANARYGLFSASASFDFAESISMNKYSLFLLVSATVNNSFRQMRDVQMNDAAVELWASGKIETFHQRFGDSYVSGIGTGGVYHAILQIDTENDEEKKEISASLKAGYNAGFQKYGVSAQFNKSIERVSARTSVKVRHLQIGGNDADVEVVPEQIVTKATNFAATVAGNRAAPFIVMTKRYETVSNLPPAPNKFDYQLARDVVRSCGKLRLRYLDWINDIDYVLSNPHQFKWNNEKKQTKALDKKSDELREAITGLARQASICADNVSKCEMPSGPLTVALNPDAIPDRKPKRKKKKRKPKAQRLHVAQANLTPTRANPTRKNPKSKPKSKPTSKPKPRQRARARRARSGRN